MIELAAYVGTKAGTFRIPAQSSMDQATTTLVQTPCCTSRRGTIALSLGADPHMSLWGWGGCTHT